MSPTDTAVGESALIVEVPEAEPLVGRWRLRHDPTAALGVPAHVTVLYPFLRPDRLDENALRSIGALAAGHEPFNAELASIESFGDEVVWLAPEPASRFRRLTEAAAARFPGHLPYQGRFDDVIPHLTIGGPGELPMADLRRELERDLDGRLPVPFRVDTLSLLVSAGGRWSASARFRLGRPPPSPGRA